MKPFQILFSVRYHQHPFEGFNGQSCGSYIPSDSEDISAACFVPEQKSLIENATMAKMYCHAHPCTGQVNSLKNQVPSPVCSCQLSARPLGLLCLNPLPVKFIALSSVLSADKTIQVPY
jgi:hypothetical protein